MAEPAARCELCCGLGRVADAPCRMCGGSGRAPSLILKCPACKGERSDDFGDDCAACGATGSVPACAQCGLEPVEALFAPCCGGTCRELWQRAQPAPIVRRAP